MELIPIVPAGCLITPRIRVVPALNGLMIMELTTGRMFQHSDFYATTLTFNTIFTTLNFVKSKYPIENKFDEEDAHINDNATFDVRLGI